MEMAAGPFQELANQKERELAVIREQHLQTLENALKSCEEELKQEIEKRQTLEEDFKYNLNLIDQRDQELLQYETVFQQLKKVIDGHVAQLSDLHVQIDDLQTKLKQETEEKGQLKQYYIQRLEQKQNHMDQFCKAKDKEVTEQRIEYERLQKQLQQRLLQIEEELENEKEEMATHYEEKLKSQGQENQRKIDELATSLLSKESHIRQLQRELSTVQSHKEETQEKASTVEEKVKQLEVELRNKDWTHTDAISTLEARIAELEGQLAHAEATNKNIRRDFDIRRIELERLSKEKETALQTAKECHRVRETDLERQVGEIRAQLEQVEIEGRRKEWNYKDELKEREIALEKLQSELVRTREEGERTIAHHSQEKVQTDLKLQSLQVGYDKIKEDLSARIQDIERYKHELHLSTERERSLERTKEQMELDWQVRLEEMERNQYGRQEELLKTLTVARDEALVYCKQVEEKLMERVRVCESIRQERDIALDALKKKGLSEIAQDILHGRGSSRTLESLQTQNQELRQVISHMRNEMEQLVTEDNNGTDINNKAQQDSKSYIRYIEKELGRLKQENQKLQDMHTKSATSNKKPPVPPNQSKQNKTENPQVAQIIKTALASFQKEKATYEFDIAQLRSRMRQLESSMRTKEEQVYVEKALQVPSDKVRQKLIQATQVIIQLVREREEWKVKEEELNSQICLLKENLKQMEELIVIPDDSHPQDTTSPTSSQPLDIPQDHIIPHTDISLHHKEPQTSVLPNKEIPSHQWKTFDFKELQHQFQSRQPLSSSCRLNIPDILTPKKSKEVTSSPVVEIPTDNLSPLRFSDSSYSSGIQGLQKALQLVEGCDDSENISPPTTTITNRRKSSTPVQSSDEELIIKGKKASCTTRGRNTVMYVAPRPIVSKPKIRNYNIKDD